jgi:3-oxoadipate enol-lactonase
MTEVRQTGVPSRGHLAVHGAELAYDVMGAGPVVVHLHGMSSSRANDLRMGLDFSEVGRSGHRLIRYDARGHGDSTGRAVPADYMWPALADDLMAVRSELATGEQVDGIGASMGCGTLLNAAVGSPAAFRRLVLVIPPTAWATRAAQGAAYRGGAQAIESHGLAAFTAMLEGLGLPPVLAEIPGFELVPQVIPTLMPSVLRGAALSDLPTPESLERLQHPTLILAWPGDPTHPEATARTLAELLPHATLQVDARLRDVKRWGLLAAEFLG